MSATELTVTVKDSEKTLRSKFLLYETYSLDENDDIVKDCVARTLKDFNSEPEKISVKASLYIL